jgi:hypothetical protein
LPNFLYAQVIKYQRKYRLVDVEERQIWGLPEDYRRLLKAGGLSGNINTSFVERINLTIRQSVSKLTQRTWGRAQYTTELSEHLYWWLVRFALSFFSLPRESADENGRTNSSQGETETERIQEDDTRSGGWSDKSAMVSDGTDQLSAAVRLGNLGENQILQG